jgi:hypothetical protein
MGRALWRRIDAACSGDDIAAHSRPVAAHGPAETDGTLDVDPDMRPEQSGIGAGASDLIAGRAGEVTDS